MTDASYFFERAREAFDAASQAAGLTEQELRVAGRPVRLRIAGLGMRVLSRAISHLAVDDSGQAPSLTLCLWDSASTGTAMPPPPWRDDQYGMRGEIAGFNRDGLRITYDVGRSMLYMIDLQRRLALCWTRDAGQLPAYEIAAPLLPIWNAWLGWQDGMLLHAAAVGRLEGGVLIVGKGGSGKSTTALACLNSPLNYLADDYCIVAGGEWPRIYSLFCTGKVRRDNLHRLPHLQPAVNSISTPEDKVICHLPDYFADKLILECPLQAILAPAITHQPNTHLRPAPASAVLMALAPSTLFQLNGAGAGEMKRMASLVKRVPGFQLQLGEAIPAIPTVINEFIKDAVAPTIQA